jgi:Rrf2 family transcriptional regulator, nitric oxide-sensitive transcriptional repressor
MRLALRTDYALRMLIYVALRPGRSCTVEEIALAYGLSRNHLLKVALALRQHGFLATARGRSGGVRLQKDPRDINIGAVIQLTEDDLALVECMQGGNCVISPGCRLKSVFAEALAAYLGVLSKYSLADIVRNRRALLPLLTLADQNENRPVP